MLRFIRSSITLLCFTLSAGFLVTGCSSINDVIKAKQDGSEGTSKEYPVTQDQAWSIAKTVLRWEGSDAIEEHRDQGYMVTSTGMSIGTAGTVMGVWVEKGAQASDIKVTVVTKRRIKLDLITSLTESTFHKRFAQGVDIVRAGKPLPSVAPKE